MREKKDLQPIIPSWLDDLKLDRSEFRILCHLWRRGETFSTAKTIGEVCRINRDTVFRVLDRLETRGLITREHRKGRTTLIRPVPQTNTGSGSTRPLNQCTTRPPNPDTYPSPKPIRKGSPSKGNPSKYSRRPI